MAGQQILDLFVGVRVPEGQPKKCKERGLKPRFYFSALLLKVCWLLETTVKQAKDSSHIQSVDRALAILKHLARGAASVGEVAKALKIHKSTAFRLLATLEQHGFVSQEVERGKYRLGMTLVHLAATVTADLDLVRIARPICERLSESVQETVNIAVLEKTEVINIDQVIGSSAVVSMNWVGKRNPLSCTSTGKVLLAFAPNTTELLKRLEPCTKHSITNINVLEKQLVDIRKLGYGFTVEELELGLNAVAAPIWSFKGEVIAAVCISGPSYRLSQDRIPELGELTKQAGLEISEKLGFEKT
jgi:IclR family transcriptional regulator, acetate operon repressor